MTKKKNVKSKRIKIHVAICECGSRGADADEPVYAHEMCDRGCACETNIGTGRTEYLVSVEVGWPKRPKPTKVTGKVVKTTKAKG